MLADFYTLENGMSKKFCNKFPLIFNLDVFSSFEIFICLDFQKII